MIDAARRRAARLVLAVLALTGGGCAEHVFDNPLDPGSTGQGLRVVALFRLGLRDVADLGFDGLHLLVADAGQRRIRVIDPADGSERSGLQLTEGSLDGLAADGTLIYVADESQRRLIRLTPAGLSAGDLPLPGSRLVALDRRDAYLYALDNDDSRLLTIDPASGREVASLSLPADDYRGVVVTADALWLLRQRDDRLLQLTLEGAEVAAYDLPIPSPRALAYDGRLFWTLDGEGTLYALDLPEG